MSVPPPPRRRPSVYCRGKSPFWQARINVWDADARKWKLSGSSTRVASRDELRKRALAVANELQRAALIAAGWESFSYDDDDETPLAAIPNRVTASHVRDTVARVMRVSGVDAGATMPRVEDFVETKLKDWSDPATRKNYKRCFDRFCEWGPSVGVPLVYMAEMADPLLIERFRDWLTDQGLSMKRVNFHLSALDQLAKKAVLFGILEKNPVQAVSKVRKTDDVDLVSADPISEDEFRRLIDAPMRLWRSKKLRTWSTWCEELAREWRIAIIIGGELGARLGDATTMTHGHVIRKPFPALDYLPEKTRKSTKKRICFPLLPLAPRTWEVLRKIPKEADDVVLLPRLAALGDNRKSDYFRYLLETAGIERTVTVTRGGLGRNRYSHGFHSLRHTANTRAKNLGLSPELRMALIGHSRQDTNAIYTHHSTEDLRQAVVRALG